MEAVTKTRGQKVNERITLLLKSRHTLLWIVTREEYRVQNACVDAIARAKSTATVWDCASGFRTAEGKPASAGDSVMIAENALRYIETSHTRSVFVMKDLHKWLGDPTVLRLVRNLAINLQSAPPNEAKAIIVLSPTAEIPPELAGHATVINYPLPDRAEVTAILNDIVKAQGGDIATLAPNADAAIDSALGLSVNEMENCFALSLASSKRIDPATVAAEKKSVIAREKVLTWYDPDPRGMEAVGGLGSLKQWLSLRRTAFSPKARAYGLPAPKGMMLVGPPGTGKSLTAKCVAAAWGVPLLRLDMGALKSKWVGESEANIRKALQVAEAVSPCVLWLDEIEKALGGATGPQGDGGVASDALGAVLSWMQEREGSVFVVATANDVRMLPPELLRKGRFDELFWVDLPTHKERVDILRASLAQYGKTVSDPDDLGMVASATAGFTGAELAALVPDAMFVAFSDNERALSCGDLRYAARSVVPLSKTAGDKLESLREWAKSRARPASEPEEQTETRGGRTVEA